MEKAGKNWGEARMTSSALNDISGQWLEWLEFKLSITCLLNQLNFFGWVEF